MLCIDRYTDLFDIRDYLDKKIGTKESDEIYDFMERREEEFNKKIKALEDYQKDYEGGVQPEFDIRTDRFEIAIDAVDKINQAVANQVAKNKGETEAVKDFGTGVKTDPEKS